MHFERSGPDEVVVEQIDGTELAVEIPVTGAFIGEDGAWTGTGTEIVS